MLTIREMQSRVNEIVKSASTAQEAIAIAQSDKAITRLCKEIITEATVKAWSARQALEIETFFAVGKGN